MSSCAGLDFALLFSEYSLISNVFLYPISRDFCPLPIDDALLRFSLVCGMLAEKETATHSSILAWRIPWTGEPGKLQPMGSQRVEHY